MQPILAALLLLCCALTASASAESDSWDFLQAVGGISVEAPLHSASGWSLPVHANVSGLERVTTKPTTLNSALVCEQTIAKVEGQSIYLTIVPVLAHANFSPRCPSAQLGNLAAGRYRVFYRGSQEQPHFLRDVSIGPG